MIKSLFGYCDKENLSSIKITFKRRSLNYRVIPTVFYFGQRHEILRKRHISTSGRACIEFFLGNCTEMHLHFVHNKPFAT